MIRFTAVGLLKPMGTNAALSQFFGQQTGENPTITMRWFDKMLDIRDHAAEHMSSRLRQNLMLSRLTWSVLI